MTAKGGGARLVSALLEVANMRMLRRSGFAVISLVALVLLLSIVDSAWGNASDRATEVKRTLRGLDYLSAILAMEQQSAGNLEMLNWEFYRRYDPAETERSYSEPELRFFQVFVSEIDYPFSFQTTVSNVLNFYRDTGRIPQDGIELIEYVSGENTFDPRVSRLIALGPDREVDVYLKVFPSVFSAVNPATGRYIDSFAEADWTPLGINIAELDEIPRDYYVVDDNGSLRLPDGFVALRVELYGETDDKVVYDHIVSKYRVKQGRP